MKKKSLLIISAICLVLMTGCVNINVPAKDNAETPAETDAATATATAEADTDTLVTEELSAEADENEQTEALNDEEYFIEKLVAEQGISREEIFSCRVGEYEGKGLFSAFIFEGSLTDDEMGVYDGRLWFVSEDGSELAHDTGSFYSVDNVLSFEGTDKSFFYVDDFYVTASVARIYGVKDQKAYEPDVSGVGGLVRGEKNDFNLVISSYDHTLTKGDEFMMGHTWKPYYFYYDADTDSFREYVATQIDEETLKAKVDRDILKDIEAAGGVVSEIYYRENGIVTVNYMLTEYYDNDQYTESYENANYDCNKKCYVDTWGEGEDNLERSSYGGTYSELLLPMLPRD